jgi:hypothetical protein
MHALLRHPDSPVPAVSALEAEAVRRPDGGLDVRFGLIGDLDALALPEASGAVGVRRDELWRHTCFEVFVGLEGAAGYLEFNLAPSGDWAAYAFDGYRSRIADPKLAAPRIATVRTGDGLTLTASLEALAGLREDQSWRANLTAVVEGLDGAVSYWAVAHAPRRPDFHHADGFVVRLPVPERP